jgi:hypothetical protein
VHWDGNDAQLVMSFNPQNVSSYTWLHFRAAQRRRSSNTAAPENTLNVLNTLKDFRVRLTDAANTSATVDIKGYLNGLQYPDSSGSLSPTSQFQYKSIMRSFRIPLNDFSGVNLNALNEIRFLFDRVNESSFQNVTGAIAVDDVEFSR